MTLKRGGERGERKKKMKLFEVMLEQHKKLTFFSTDLFSSGVQLNVFFCYDIYNACFNKSSVYVKYPVNQQTGSTN